MTEFLITLYNKQQPTYYILVFYTKYQNTFYNTQQPYGIIIDIEL